MPSAPLTVADPLGLPGLAYPARTAATRSFGRRPDEVPAARRFIREAMDGHPAAFDAELLACELVTNTVQHATDADWVTIAVSHRGAIVHGDVMDDGQTGPPHWREATGEDEGGRGFQLVNEIAQRWGSSASEAAPASDSSSYPRPLAYHRDVTLPSPEPPRCGMGAALVE